MRKIKVFLKANPWMYSLLLLACVIVPVGFYSANIKGGVILYILMVAAPIPFAIMMDKFSFSKKVEQIQPEAPKMSKKEYLDKEADTRREYPELKFLSLLLEKGITEMGLDRRDYVAPKWLVNVNAILRRYVQRRSGMPITDIQLAAFAMYCLIGKESTEDDVFVIYQCLKPLIQNPAEYTVRVEGGKCKLTEEKRLATCDVDQYMESIGESNFYDIIKSHVVDFQENAFRIGNLPDFFSTVHTYGYEG